MRHSPKIPSSFGRPIRVELRESLKDGCRRLLLNLGCLSKSRTHLVTPPLHGALIHVEGFPNLRAISALQDFNRDRAQGFSYRNAAIGKHLETGEEGSGDDFLHLLLSELFKQFF